VFVERIEIDERAIHAAPESTANTALMRGVSYKKGVNFRESTKKVPTEEVTIDDDTSQEFHLVIQTMEDGFNSGRRCVDACSIINRSSSGGGVCSCVRSDGWECTAKGRTP